MMEITKDSEYVLLTLYKAYKDKQSQGISRKEAKNFGSAKEIGQHYFPKANPNDLIDSLGELSKNDLIYGHPGSDTFVLVYLEDRAIYEMENRFKNNFKNLIDTIAKLRGLGF